MYVKFVLLFYIYGGNIVLKNSLIYHISYVTTYPISEFGESNAYENLTLSCKDRDVISDRSSTKTNIITTVLKRNTVVEKPSGGGRIFAKEVKKKS